ncbi:MAG: methyltransferase domain-containing protein [Kiloniellales bacterium]
MTRRRQRTVRPAATGRAGTGSAAATLGALMREAAALGARGRHADAVAAWRRALKLAPGFAPAHHRLGRALTDLGRPMDGLKHHFEAFRHDRERPAYRQALAAALRVVRLNAASDAVAEAMLALFGADDVDHQDLAEAGLGLVKADSAFAQALAAARRDDQAAFTAVAAGRRFADWLAQPLLQSILRQTVVADADAELVFTYLRRSWLQRAVGQGLDGVGPAALGALADQCFSNEYLFAETAAETTAVEALAGRLTGARTGAELDQSALVVYAAYRPLDTLLDIDRRLADAAAGPLAGLMRRQVTEPRSERELAATLPQLTPIDDDATSRAVRRQYEESPYPRWLSMTRRQPRALDEIVSELFPGIDRRYLPTGALRVLVAGCGTGRHALQVACRFADADVLAVDLSRAALAYGARRARELGVANLRFAQADIRHLGGLEERFQLIECSGVLHHMADPVAGWRVLAGLMAPDGLIKLGLYSRLGRAAITAARRFVAARGLPPTPDGIRDARRAIRALPAEDPARAVAEEFDFYTMSACRDLIFNVQEARFDLPRIAAAIDALGLGFLGFEFFDAAVPRAYRRRFPEDPAMTDLGKWHAFEAERPTSFRTMYQFWCRRA